MCSRFLPEEVARDRKTLKRFQREARAEERRLAEPEAPGGVNRQAERLRAGGHRILPGTGKRPLRVALSEPRAR